MQPLPSAIEELRALIAQHCYERRTAIAIPRVGLVLLVSVDPPTTSVVTQASPDTPYLALSPQLDPAVRADIEV